MTTVNYILPDDIVTVKVPDIPREGTMISLPDLGYWRVRDVAFVHVREIGGEAFATVAVNIRLEPQEEIDGLLPRLHGGHHVGAEGRDERGSGGREDPARRARGSAHGAGAVQDQDPEVAATDRGGAHGELPGRGDGGSPDDLSTAAPSLKVDEHYNVVEGVWAGSSGVLKHVHVTSFGRVVCTLETEVGASIVVRGTDLVPA